MKSHRRTLLRIAALTFSPLSPLAPQAFAADDLAEAAAHGDVPLYPGDVGYNPALHRAVDDPFGTGVECGLT